MLIPLSPFLGLELHEAIAFKNISFRHSTCSLHTKTGLMTFDLANCAEIRDLYKHKLVFFKSILQAGLQNLKER